MPTQRNRKKRPIIFLPHSPSIALVELTQDQFSVIDADDADRVGRFNWCAMWNPCIHGFYAARGTSKGSGDYGRYLHQFILGELPGFTPDHINRITLDNRRANLRHATRSEQQMNQSIRINNRSGVRGVCFEKEKKKWSATRYIDGKKLVLGYRASIEEASELLRKFDHQ